MALVKETTGQRKLQYKGILCKGCYRLFTQEARHQLEVWHGR